MPVDQTNTRPMTAEGMLLALDLAAETLRTISHQNQTYNEQFEDQLPNDKKPVHWQDVRNLLAAATTLRTHFPDIQQHNPPTLTPEETKNLDQIEQLWADTLPGPWTWFLQSKPTAAHLVTNGRGMKVVMGFRGSGKGNVQPTFRTENESILVPAVELCAKDLGDRGQAFEIPNPHARAIAASRQHVDTLLAIVRRLTSPVTIPEQTWSQQ